MSSERVSAVESGRGVFHLAVATHGIAIEADEPVNAGGLGQGLTPNELLCAALAACTTITLRMYCMRKAWQVKSIRTDVVETPRNDQTPHAHFERTIHVDGNLTDGQIEKLLSIANHCPVHVTLESASEIATQLKNSSLMSTKETPGAPQ